MLRFGKHSARTDYRTLRMSSYLGSTLAPPPPSADTLQRVFNKLGDSNVPALFPMDGNDTYGDCTIAALAHAITVNNGLIGKSVVPLEVDVVKLYFTLTKGQDSGLAELDVLNYWQSNAVAGDQIAAYVAISQKNLSHVRQAIDIFGGVYLGFQVQAACQDDFNAGRPWTPGTLLNEGHAVYAVGYDENYVTVLTWGATQKATWDWWDACVDEAYAILPPEAMQPGFHENFNSAQLQVDLNAVAN